MVFCTVQNNVKWGTLLLGGGWSCTRMQMVEYMLARQLLKRYTLNSYLQWHERLALYRSTSDVGLCIAAAAVLVCVYRAEVIDRILWDPQLPTKHFTVSGKNSYI